jgi:hypothetical protein
MTMRRRAGLAWAVLATSCALARPAGAQDALQWNGFAIVRGASSAPPPLDGQRVSAQAQLALDWVPAPVFLGHVHVAARTDDEGSRRGAFGVVEAYLEAQLFPGRDRVRLRGGATFLPSSRENVDALWENPFFVSSSALNTWLGEEFRPIGVDVAWLRADGLVLGATVYRGNDTFGALPPAQGFSLSDRWILLGERIPVGRGHFTSVSAETDRRLGWAGRAGWSGRRAALQVTHVDNRSDGLEHGELFNWNTRFDIVGGDLSLGDWTLAAEAGFGPTFLIVRGRRIVSDLRAGYVLASRRLPWGRTSLRLDSFGNGATTGTALTAACFWTPSPRLTAGIEVLTTGDAGRVLAQVRYGFGF